jgi:hypothetical protein
MSVRVWPRFTACKIPFLTIFRDRPWGNALQAVHDMFALLPTRASRGDPKAPGDLLEGITGLGFVFENVSSGYKGDALICGAGPSLGNYLLYRLRRGEKPLLPRPPE